MSLEVSLLILRVCDGMHLYQLQAPPGAEYGASGGDMSSSVCTISGESLLK